MAEVTLWKSCLWEIFLTFVLIFVIFFFSFSKYNEKIKIGKFTFGPLITGLVLAALIYISIVIMTSTNFSILTGHMSPLYTIYCMISNKVFGKDSIYGDGITLKIGAALIGSQFAGLFLAFAFLYIIYRYGGLKNE